MRACRIKPYPTRIWVGTMRNKPPKGRRKMGRRRTNQLQVLHDHLDAINTDILVVESPIERLDTLLGDVSDALNRPKELSDELKSIADIFSQIRTVAHDARWIPEIGEDAESLAEALAILVEGIGDIRTALDEIDRALKPLKAQLKEVKKPVDKVYKSIHKVQLGVANFEKGTEALIQRYGSHPPNNVEKCAAGFNKGIDTVARDFDRAKDQVARQVSAILDPLGEIDRAFVRLDGYMSAVRHVYNESSAFRTALRKIAGAVHTAESYGEKELKRLLSAIGRAIHPGLYKKVKGELDEVEGKIKELEGRLASFLLDPIKRQVDSLEDTVKHEIENIPELKPLEDAAAAVQKALDKLENQVIGALSGACAKLLGAERS